VYFLKVWFTDIPKNFAKVVIYLIMNKNFVDFLTGKVGNQTFASYRFYFLSRFYHDSYQEFQEFFMFYH